MKNIIKMNYPTRWFGAKWREALPSGNGEVGIGVYGEIMHETVMISHTDLWWRSRTPEMPDVSYTLPKIRKALLEGDARKADRIMVDEFKRLGYDPSVGFPLPLCDLKIYMPISHAFKKYERRLCMENGEITVSFCEGESRIERSAFVSRSDDVIVYRITDKNGGKVSADVSLALHDTEDAARHTTDLRGYLPKNAISHADGKYIFFSAQNDDGTDFGAVARLITDVDASECDGGLKVEGAREILLIIKAFVKSDSKSEFAKLKSKLSAIDADYNTLLSRHAALHRQMFLNTELSLDCEARDRSNEELLLEAYKDESSSELIEKLWSYGRYLLISASREGGNPCSLYGLWCGDYQGMWAFNMFNENVQMIYWQALSGNMPELLLPVFDYVERYMDDYRENARKLFGCRGIFLPAPSTPESGLVKILLPHILHWTAGAGWVAQHYYKYYEYTLDTEFLKSRALPFMREVALFYEDFFVEDKNGKYMSIPSVSPENSPAGYNDPNDPTDNMETTVNATMDFAIAKELLTNLLNGGKITEMYRDEWEKWENMLSRIPDYQINEDGAIKEWMHDSFLDNYHHRHLSHIYPLFPGNEVTKKDKRLYDACVTAFNKRLAIGLNQQTGWSFAHLANCYARIGDGDGALSCIDNLARSCVQSNFFTMHNDTKKMGIGVEKKVAPIQIDANMGITAAVNEMLVRREGDIIYILPALPKKWRRGSVKGLLVSGGIVVSVDWDIDKSKITATLASQHTDCTLIAAYMDNEREIRLVKDRPFTIEF